MVRKIPKLTQLFSKRKKGLFQLTLSGLGTDTFFVDLLWFHSPLPWWMKRRTCTKSEFSGLGPRLLCLSDDRYNLTVLPQFLTLRHTVFIWTSLCCRTGTVRGTLPTQTWPSVFRTRYWCGSPVSIYGCWALSTAFTSTAMTVDAFKCPASAPPRWWDTDFGQSSVYCSKLFTRLKSDTKVTFLPVFLNNVNRNIQANVNVEQASFFNQSFSTFLSCSGVGFPAGFLWLCGVLLHPAGKEPGDPAAHGLPSQPNHSQHDCGKYWVSFLILCLPTCLYLYKQKIITHFVWHLHQYVKDWWTGSCKVMALMHAMCGAEYSRKDKSSFHTYQWNMYLCMNLYRLPRNH